MMNQSTDVQVHNGSENKAKISQFTAQKLRWFFYIYLFFFRFIRMKELELARINWKWLNVKSLRINMFQTNTRKKSVNFPVTSC